MTDARDAPEASVVVAACNRREKTLACMRALLAQTHRAYEIIMVDDGSTDGTPDAVEELARTARVPLRVLRNVRNMGANPSRNRGVREARGALVAFIDSDCYADAEWLARLTEPFADARVGAVTGLVDDTPATNAWELAFRGTHRLPRRGPVGRVVIGNLCVRRALLAAHALDESRPTRRLVDGSPDLAISARSDEEGLNLALRAAGWKVLAEPSARAVHDHPYSFRSLMRQAWFGGQSAAELVWKYRLGPRKDLAPIALFDATLVAALAAWPFVSPLVFLAPLAALVPPVAAISYNELRNKGKTPLELLRSAPALAIYYQVRLAGYARRRVELLFGRRAIARVARTELARMLPPPEGVA